MVQRVCYHIKSVVIHNIIHKFTIQELFFPYFNRNNMLPLLKHLSLIINEQQHIDLPGDVSSSV